jgi:HSP20 family protein
MTKVKRSFFERITGTKEEEQIYHPNVSIRPEGQPYDQGFRREPQEYPMSFPKPVELEPESTHPATDNEGQLTIDVYQTENDIVIKSTIAGVKPDDLDVSISNDMLTVRGERRQDEQVSEENYYYQECYWGSFSRSVILPVDVMPDKIEASMKNGILTIRMPKADHTRTKKIQVRGF